ncbi:MAG TPA: DUF3788 family protein [Spirochaetota bacterium]|nr:DUF3788 family protein [Spirochaetota bacterium]
MSVQLLRDENIYPDEKVLKELSGISYSIYEELVNAIKGNDYNLTVEWNYYKDGKSWLCKVLYKKKTVFWLSLWDDCFKVTFYFTEKTEKNIYDLDIDLKLKEKFMNEKAIGKLKPLIINVNNKSQIEGMLKIVEYKKSLK